jgi:hypothetical protein
MSALELRLDVDRLIAVNGVHHGRQVEASVTRAKRRVVDRDSTIGVHSIAIAPR